MPERFFSRTGGLVAALLAGCMAPAGLLRADETTMLDTVVVTGTRSQKPLLDTPVRTQVVTREDLQRDHADSVTEALDSVPGVLLQPIHGKSGHEVWLQGLSGDRVLVLLDGQPMSARTGSTVDLSQIAVQDVERIEITKGAVSALYGSRAMGGVINVITREPANDSGYSLSLEGGTHGDKDRGDTPSDAHVSGSARTGIGRGSVAVTGDWRESSGYDLDPDTYTAEGYEGSRGNVAATLAYDFGGGTRVQFRPDYYREDTSRPFATFAPGQGEIRQRKIEEAERLHLPATVTLPAGANRFRLKALYERFEDHTAQDVLSTPAVDQQRDAVIELGRGELQWDRPVGDSHLLTGGITVFRETLSQEQQRVSGADRRDIVEIEPGAERESVEVYLQDDIMLGRHWEVVPGLRYHEDSDFGGFPTPKINLFHQRIADSGLATNIRLGIGRGYRTPNLKERYYRFDHSALGYMVLGNPDLEPERSSSLQFGVEWAMPGAWRIDTNLFYNRLTNLITTGYDEDASADAGLAVYRYQNVDRATTRGVELAGNRRLTDSVRLRASYTHLRARDETTGNTLPERPRHQAGLGLRWTPQGWGTSIDLDATWRSEEYVDLENTRESPAWARWDLRINTDITPRLTTFFGIDNLTDVHRDPADGLDQRPVRPRYVYLGIRYSR